MNNYRQSWTHPNPRPQKVKVREQFFCPYDLLNSPATTTHNSLSKVSAVADTLQNLTFHTHREQNEWVTGCLVCQNSFEQTMGGTSANDMHQTAQAGESVRAWQLKRKAFLAGSQSRGFTFIPQRVSQTAASEGLTYTVNFDSLISDKQGYPLPLFEHQN